MKKIIFLSILSVTITLSANGLNRTKAELMDQYRKLGYNFVSLSSGELAIAPQEKMQRVQEPAPQEPASQRGRLQVNQDAFAQEKAKLERQIAELGKKNAELSRRNADLEKGARDSFDAISGLSKTFEEKDAKIAEQETELTQAKNDAEELRGKLEETRNEATRIAEEKKQAEGEIQSLRAQIAAAEENVRKSQDELEEEKEKNKGALERLQEAYTSEVYRQLMPKELIPQGVDEKTAYEAVKAALALKPLNDVHKQNADGTYPLDAKGRKIVEETGAATLNVSMLLRAAKKIARLKSEVRDLQQRISLVSNSSTKEKNPVANEPQGE